MSDDQLKKLALASLVMDAVENFRTVVENKDGDDLWCCRGEMCGCGGMTNREMWKVMAGIEDAGG